MSRYKTLKMDFTTGNSYAVKNWHVSKPIKIFSIQQKEAPFSLKSN